MNKKKKTYKSKKRIWITAAFILYIVLLLFMVLLVDRSEGETYQYNLVLFDEIKRYFRYREQFGNWIFLRNILGNVAGFIPMGACWPYIFPKMRSPVLVTLVCFEWSLVIETTQLVFRLGSFDVDDLLLNTLGGLIGCILYYIWMIIWRKRRKSHVQKKQ